MTGHAVNKGYLYLPMEIFVREFDSRLLIAFMALERGMDVILGQKWLMERNIRSMPPGLWIFKTMTLRDSAVMMKARQAGHSIASIDEEVPGMAEGSCGLTWVSEQAVACCDGIFCAGAEHQKSMTEKWPEHVGKLLPTGNPRWDYLRPEMSSFYAGQAAALKREHGPFLLINTNIGETNSAKYSSSSDVTKRYINRGKLDTSSSENMKLWEDYLDFERANFAAVVSLVPALAKAFPDHAIIVRPHPSENIETYRTLFAGMPRIKVIFQGPAAAWIMASDVLIHTACTTGTEAFALGKPAIGYEPKPSRWHSLMLSGRLSMTAHSEQDVLGCVARLLGDATTWADFANSRRPVFEHFFYGAKGPLASENIVAQCERLVSRLPFAPSARGWRPKFGFLPWWYLRKNNKRLFPAVSTQDIEARLRTLSQCLGRQLDASITRVGDRMYKLSRL